MMELLLSRLMAAAAAAMLIACITSVFLQTQGENEETALRREVDAITAALSVPAEGSGSIVLHGKDMLPAGHLVSLIGSVLVLQADGKTFVMVNLSDLQNEMRGEWSSASDLRLCWSDSGTYLYLLNESANLRTAAESRRQSSFVL